MEAIFVGTTKPVDGVLIEKLSDQFMHYLAEECTSKRLPTTVGLKDPLYVAYQALIDVCVDLLRETSQINYLETCKAVVDLIEPIKESAGNVETSSGIPSPRVEDNRNYREFLRAKALVFVLDSNNAYTDDAIFVLTVLRAGLKGLMAYHGPEDVRLYAKERLSRRSVDIVRFCE